MALEIQFRSENYKTPARICKNFEKKTSRFGGGFHGESSILQF